MGVWILCIFSRSSDSRPPDFSGNIVITDFNQRKMRAYTQLKKRINIRFFMPFIKANLIPSISLKVIYSSVVISNEVAKF